MKALKEGPFLPRFGKPGEVTLIGGRAATGKKLACAASDFETAQEKTKGRFAVR